MRFFLRDQVWNKGNEVFQLPVLSCVNQDEQICDSNLYRLTIPITWLSVTIQYIIDWDMRSWRQVNKLTATHWKKTTFYSFSVKSLCPCTVQTNFCYTLLSAFTELKIGFVVLLRMKWLKKHKRIFLLPILTNSRLI